MIFFGKLKEKILLAVLKQSEFDYHGASYVFKVFRSLPNKDHVTDDTFIEWTLFN